MPIKARPERKLMEQLIREGKPTPVIKERTGYSLKHINLVRKKIEVQEAQPPETVTTDRLKVEKAEVKPQYPTPEIAKVKESAKETKQQKEQVKIEGFGLIIGQTLWSIYQLYPEEYRSSKKEVFEELGNGWASCPTVINLVKDKENLDVMIMAVATVSIMGQPLVKMQMSKTKKKERDQPEQNVKKPQ